MASRVVCCDVVVAGGERNFSIKKEKYHCGSGVDYTFAGFRDVFDKKPSAKCEGYLKDLDQKFALFWWDQLAKGISH
jgi:hypothetical protein